MNFLHFEIRCDEHFERPDGQLQHTDNSRSTYTSDEREMHGTEARRGMLRARVRL